MSNVNGLNIKICFLSCVTAFIAGCWGPVWPHRRFTVDLAAAKTSVENIKGIVANVLLSHQCTYAGKGGYDAIRNTSTILDYKCENGLMVSTGSNRIGGVLVSFDQNRPVFTKDAQKLFDELLANAEKRWPGAVKEKPRRINSGAGSPH